MNRRSLISTTDGVATHAAPRVQASLGGGGGFEGFYGSVTAGGVSKVYAAMQEHCDFSPSSFLVDIGGGLGRCDRPQPVTHAWHIWAGRSAQAARAP